MKNGKNHVYHTLNPEGGCEGSLDISDYVKEDMNVNVMMLDDAVGIAFSANSWMLWVMFDPELEGANDQCSLGRHESIVSWNERRAWWVQREAGSVLWVQVKSSWRSGIAYTEAFDQARLPTYVLSSTYQTNVFCNYAVCYGIRILKPEYLHYLLAAADASWKQVADSQDSFSLPDETSPDFAPEINDSVTAGRRDLKLWLPDPARPTLFKGWKVLALRANIVRPNMSFWPHNADYSTGYSGEEMVNCYGRWIWRFGCHDTSSSLIERLCRSDRQVVTKCRSYRKQRARYHWIILLQSAGSYEDRGLEGSSRGHLWKVRSTEVADW
jgi:hypothetical protein